MTLTETRPAETPGGVDAPPVEHGVAALVATGEHKRLGLLFAAGGLASVVAALVATAIFHIDAELPDSFAHPGSRLTSAATVGAFVIGIPALWIGLATYVVPLQIGGHRLAMPRLHALALWFFAGGGVLCAAAYLFDDTRLNSLASAVPPASAEGARAPDATLLLVAGLVLVGVGTLLAAGNIFVTILNRRAEGFRLLHVPAFTWSAMGTSLVLVLSTPVFLAGLVVLYLDQRYGAGFFPASAKGGLRIWEHELWLLGRPESLVFFAAGLGIYCDVVATTLRRPLALFPVARAASAAAPVVALVAWVGGTSLLTSPFPPFGTVLSAAIAVPALLCLATWALSVRGARPRLLASTLPLLAHFLLDGLLVAALVAAALSDVEGPEIDHFRNGHVSLFVLGLTLLGFATGFLHWAPKLRGRVPSIGAGAGAAALLAGGAVLLAAPGYLMGLEADDGVTVLGAVGAGLLVLGLLSLLPTIVGPAGSAPADPYGGLTLEWAASSPPVRHNFEEVPDIVSPYPLADLRAGAADAEERS
ncbi:MAG TPA: cbb3-type cytochrome c oxidase subunit I [Acidimicrobiales bacterium]|nr:cbb3-type cytochrome c oxidase subunit I [Acidimicrobiales bacterium]